MTYAQYVDTSATTTHNPSQNYNHLDYTITCYPRVKTIYCFIVFVWFFLFVSLLVVRGTTGMDMRKEEINLKCIKCILYLSYLPAAPFFFFFYNSFHLTTSTALSVGRYTMQIASFGTRKLFAKAHICIYIYININFT